MEAPTNMLARLRLLSAFQALQVFDGAYVSHEIAREVIETYTGKAPIGIPEGKTLDEYLAWHEATTVESWEQQIQLSDEIVDELIAEERG